MSRSVTDRIGEVAPLVTTSAVHRALDLAILGVGPLAGAATSATRIHDSHHGDEIASVREIIETHVRMAAGQGFVTNLGGLVTMTVTAPANVAGLAFIQSRMAASILHLRNYDLADSRVRNAILAALLGEDKVLELLKQRKVPATPMAMATAPVDDPNLAHLMANELASELVQRVAGKRLATAVGRRTPIVGGMVGAGTDGFTTWKIGRYVDREFLARSRR